MSAKILVTGGTGTTGSHLVNLLHEQKADFKALVRSEEKARPLQEKGVATTIGDFASTSSIDKALDGVEKVFLLSAAGPDQVEHQGNFVQSCQKAAVKYIVKVSAIGTAADSPVALARWHAQTEEEIRKSGLNYTFLHPHAFMQNQFANIETIKSQGAIYAPMADAKFATVDARDIASVATRLLSEDGHEGKTYLLTGPEAISMSDIAGTLERLLGKEVNYLPVSFEDARKAMLGMGMPEWLADDLTELNKIFAAGHGAEVSNDIETVTSKKATPFEQFAKDHIDFFK